MKMYPFYIYLVKLPIYPDMHPSLDLESGNTSLSLLRHYPQFWNSSKKIGNERIIIIQIPSATSIPFTTSTQ